MTNNGRVETIDLWRGLVLAIIFINHIPGNIVEHITPRNFGLSDSSEAFVFISGFAVALVYFPKMMAGDVWGVTKRCIRRAVQIYGVHILITAAALALFGKAFVATGNEEFLSANGRDLVMAEPVRATLGLLLMSHQIGYFNILPLYVVLMLFAPLMMLLARMHVGLALGVSIAIYTMTRSFGLNLPNWPGEGVWFFDPLAWQLIFTIGIVSAIVWRKMHALPAYPSLMVLAGLSLWAGLVVVGGGFGLSPHLWDAMRGPLDLTKSELGLGRLFHFLAIAYVVSISGLGQRMLALPFAGALKVMGRHGLAIFAAGSLLSALGQIVVAQTHENALIGAVFIVAGLMALVAFARWLDWSARTAATSARIQSSAQPPAQGANAI